MEDVGQDLVIGVGMDRRHDAAHDPDALVQRLHERREAVGRARGIRDDMHRRGERVVIDPVDDRGVDHALGRRRNHDLLGAALDVLGGLFLVGEKTRALEHVLDAEFAPRQLGRVALGQHADAVAVDDHRIAVDLHLAREAAVGGVMARQVGIGLRIAEVVDGDDVDLALALALIERAQRVATDTSVAVDTDFDGHETPLDRQQNSERQIRARAENSRALREQSAPRSRARARSTEKVPWPAPSGRIR